MRISFFHPGARSALRTIAAVVIGVFLGNNLAWAASCNTTDYEGFYRGGEGMTYAITKQVMTWTQAKALAEANNATLAQVTNLPQNNKIASDLGTFFTTVPSPPAPTSGAKAWIGLHDPSRNAGWCEDGDTCDPMSERFEWTEASNSFTNWANGQPDNRCTPAERQAHPDKICYGEHWGTIDQYGTWSDEGDHGQTALKLKAVTQWRDELDCVKNVSQPDTDDGEQTTLEGGLLVCQNQAKTRINQCVKTAGGEDFCPEDKVACNAVLEQPTCPTGSSLNKTTNMCEGPAKVDCPDGSAPPTTVMPPIKSCPIGYEAINGRCEMAPKCTIGTYNAATNKCESGGTSTYPATATQTPVTASFTKSNCYAVDGMMVWNHCIGAGYASTVSFPNSTQITTKIGIYPFSPTGIGFASSVPIAGFSSAVIPGGATVYYPQTSGTYTVGSVTDYSCPNGGTLSGTTCTVNTLSQTNPECPNGAFENQGTVADVCWAPTDDDCPTGTAYNSVTKMCDPIVGGSCQQNPAKSCPDGYESVNNRCEMAPKCELGGTYNAVTNKCQGGGSTTTVAAGSRFRVWDYDASAIYYAVGKCIGSCPESPRLPPSPELTLRIVNKVDILNGAQVAYGPDGTTIGYDFYFNATSDINVDSSPTCPNGTFEDQGNADVCWSPATTACPFGTTINLATGKCDPLAPSCLADPYKGCPQGYSLDESNGECIREPACETGATYNHATNKCESMSTQTYPATATNSSVSFTMSTCISETGRNCGTVCTGTGYISPTPFLGSIAVSRIVSARGTCDMYASGEIGYVASAAKPGLVQGAIRPYGYGDERPLSLTTNDCVWTGDNYECGGGTPGWYASSSGNYNIGPTVYSCPNGGTLSGTTCTINTQIQINPTCPSGSFRDNGTFNDRCYTPYTTSCPAGTTWNIATGKCETGGSITCPTGLSYNGCGSQKCEAIPICDNGIYNPDNDLCFKNDSFVCPTDPLQACYQLQGDTTESLPGVPMRWCTPNTCGNNLADQIETDDETSGQNDLKDDGTINEDGSCSGAFYIYNGKDMRCVKKDIRNVIGSVAKIAVTVALMATGVGAALSSMLVAAGMTATSAAAVVSAAVQAVGTVVGDAVSGQLGTSTLMAVGMNAAFAAMSVGADLSGLGAKMDGMLDTVKDRMANSIDSLGSSMNMDFSGLSSAIRPTMGPPVIDPVTGVITSGDTFSGTINKLEGYIRDTTGMSQQTLDNIKDGAVEGAKAGFFSSYTPMKCCYPDKLSAACKPEERQLWSMAKNGLCHKVGAYCSKKWLSACVQQKETRCCFSSKLARIIHEQGRPQLPAFETNPWGNPRGPQCRGFTTDEFQSMDFSQIDFSEYVADIEEQMQEVTGKIEGYMNSIMDRKGAAFEKGAANNPLPIPSGVTGGAQ